MEAAGVSVLGLDCGGACLLALGRTPPLIQMGKPLIVISGNWSEFNTGGGCLVHTISIGGKSLMDGVLLSSIACCLFRLSLLVGRYVVEEDSSVVLVILGV